MRNTRIQTCNNILPQGFHTFEVYSILLFDMQYCNQGIKIMDLLKPSNHVVQNGHTGEQMTHLHMLKKATKFEFSLFNMSQCVICSPIWRFLYHVVAQLQMAHSCQIERKIIFNAIKVNNYHCILSKSLLTLVAQNQT